MSLLLRRGTIADSVRQGGASIITAGALTSRAYSGTLSNTLTIAKPASVVEGTLMTAHMEVFGSVTPSLSSTPVGWMQIGATRLYHNTDAWMLRFVKVAGASEPSSYSWVFGSTYELEGTIMPWFGVDTATPQDVTATINSAASGTSVTAPGLTTASDGVMLIWDAAVYNVFSNNLTNPVGFTAGYSSSNGFLRTAYALQPSAGASGNKSGTASGSTPWGAGLIALRPAA